MTKRLLFLMPAVLSGLLVGAQPAFAYTWQKDPDVVLDPASLQATVTQLLAPAATIGDSDLTAVGIGLDPVGVDDSLTSPPFDPADSSPGTTFFVDNSPNDGACPPTTYMTIQSAVDASGPGDTVKVCPGTYPEQVRITGHKHDGLKLEAVVPLQAVIQWPVPESPPVALVDFNMADNVTLRSFTITGPFTFPGCSPDRHEGLLVEDAYNEHIHHNHITMIKNSVNTLRGCQEGDAVAIGRRTTPAGADATNPGSAHVDHNQIDEYQKNGIQAVNAGTTLQADHNVVTGSTDPGQRAMIASNGFSMFRHPTVIVDHNIVSQNQYSVGHFSTGIIMDETPSGSSRVDHNRVFQNDYGIEADSEFNDEISHNDVFQNTNDAITLCGSPPPFCGPVGGFVVRANNVQNNGGSGIFLTSATANLLKSNQVTGNGPDMVFGSGDGIHLDKTSTNNQVISNQASNNVTWDCHDEWTGAGTAGTANNWQNDHGQTSMPTGICT